MGLDEVEIILEVEDEFKLQLPDDLVSSFRTVGHVWDAVCECADHIETDDAWRRIRDIFAEQTGVARDEVTKQTVIQDIICD